MAATDNPLLRPSSVAAASATATPSAKTIDKEVSRRFALLRFPLIVAVVFIHGYVTTVGLQSFRVGSMYSSAWSWVVREFISQELCRVAVPGFFIIAGYLCFWGFEGTLRQYGRRLWRRVPTLLIPYVLWNLLVIGLYALLQSRPGLQQFVSGQNLPVAQYDLSDWIAQFTGTHNYPAAYQFWFIRDLMILVVLALPLYWLLRVAGHVVMLALLVGWFAGVLPGIPPFDEPPLFFALGAWLAYTGISPGRLDALGPWACAVTLVLAVAAVACKWYELSDWPHKVMILTGLVAVYWLVGQIREGSRTQRVLAWAAPASFFVFAAHEPLMMGLRKIAYFLLMPGPGGALALYFVVPLLTIGICLAAYQLLDSLVPGVLALATGGRTRTATAAA